MKAKHTPGPWEFSGNTEVAGISSATTGERIAYVKPTNWSNARLIAAAPDLLAALVEINTWLIAPATDSTTIGLFRSVVRRAISLTKGEFMAKARGGA